MPPVGLVGLLSRVVPFYKEGYERFSMLEVRERTLMPPRVTDGGRWGLEREDWLLVLLRGLF